MVDENKNMSDWNSIEKLAIQSSGKYIDRLFSWGFIYNVSHNR